MAGEIDDYSSNPDSAGNNKLEDAEFVEGMKVICLFVLSIGCY